MADASVKIGVSGVSQFKQGMSDAQASVKALDAAIKMNEKSLKATGDAEAYMATQTNLLNEKLQQQRNIAKNAQQALEQMDQNGVKKSSKAYQDMQRQMIEAQSAAMDTEAQLNGLGTAASNTAEKTDKLATSLGGLNKKVSLQQVISAVDSITGAMEKAARKALDLGKAIWENITDTARYSDDVATQAMNLNMDVETYQRYKGVFDTIGEITVQEWQKAKLKVQKAINDPTQDQTDILNLLGIKTHATSPGKYGEVQGAAREFEEVFWEIGEVLRQEVASGELTQDLADTYANAIFGRGFSGLNSLFDLGKEGFAAALKDQAAASEEAIKKNAELNDKLLKLNNDFKALETEVTGALAPALSGAADALSGLMGNILEYLQTPEGQKMLEDLSTAVTGLLENLGSIDPEAVTQGFVDVFTKITDGVSWLVKNWPEVVNALSLIVAGWAGLELTGGALRIAELFSGIAGLAGGAAAEAGAAAGASWGAAFANAVAAAAPWLVGAYALLNPAEAADDSFFNNKTGQLTDEGWKQFEAYAKGKAAGKIIDQGWDDIINLVGDRYGGLSDILGNTAAINAMARALYGDHSFPGIDPMAQPEAYMQRINNELFDTLEGMGYEPKIEIVPSEEVAGLFKNDGAIEVTVGDPTGRRWTPKGWIEPEVPVEPEVADPEAAAAAISAAIGTVTIGVVPAIGMPSGAAAGALAGGANLEAAYRQYIYNQDRSNGTGRIYANGIYSVPFDGMFAVLHKNERVVPARAMSGSRMFNSNLYIENMNMNNGQDADGLAARIAAANKRTMSGFGS